MTALPRLYPQDAPVLERLTWVEKKRKQARACLRAWQHRFDSLDRQYRHLRAEALPLAPGEDAYMEIEEE